MAVLEFSLMVVVVEHYFVVFCREVVGKKSVIEDIFDEVMIDRNESWKE